MEKLVSKLEEVQKKYKIPDNEMEDLAHQIGEAIGELKGMDMEELKDKYLNNNGENDDYEGTTDEEEEDGEFDYNSK